MDRSKLLSFSPYRAVNTLHLSYKNQLMLYRDIITMCSQIHTKHINTLCGQKVEFVNVKLEVHIVTTGGTYSDHWAVKALNMTRNVTYQQRNTKSKHNSEPRRQSTDFPQGRSCPARGIQLPLCICVHLNVLVKGKRNKRTRRIVAMLTY